MRTCTICGTKLEKTSAEDNIFSYIFYCPKCDPELTPCPHCHHSVKTLEFSDDGLRRIKLQCTGCRRQWQIDNLGYWHGLHCSEEIVADYRGEVILEALPSMIIECDESENTKEAK